eukprot:m.91579 g.91579  ORF g.91579 m.91579 type:complete len:435 (-) comp8875_c0_seq2:46-1350(-)
MKEIGSVKNVKSELIKLLKNETKASLPSEKREQLHALLKEQWKRKKFHAEQELLRAVKQALKKCLKATKNNIKRNKNKLEKGLIKEGSKVTTEMLEAEIVKLTTRQGILEEKDDTWALGVVEHSIKPSPEEVAAFNPVLGHPSLKDKKLEWKMCCAEIDINAAEDEALRHYGTQIEGKKDEDMHGVSLTDVPFAFGSDNEDEGEDDTVDQGKEKRKKSTTKEPVQKGKGKEIDYSKNEHFSDYSSGDEDEAVGSNVASDDEGGVGMVGFHGMVAGDSDDEWDDEELQEMKKDLMNSKQDNEGGKKNKKKNRPGQRIRQLRAEKQYGDKATHKKNPNKDANLRQRLKKEHQKDRWNGRGKGSSDAKGKKEEMPSKRAKQVQPSRNQRTQSLQKESDIGATASQEMHPSWVAKQQQRKKMGKVEFTGQRITFADED